MRPQRYLEEDERTEQSGSSEARRTSERPDQEREAEEPVRSGMLDETAGPATPAAAEGRRARWVWPLVVCVLTALYASLPPLVGSSFFYARGDSGAQFLPTWFHLGELVREGAWPPLMDPDSWAGGNYAAESLFGVYSPLNAVLWLVTSSLPDLLLAAVVTKALVMVLLALGTYLLSREYGAAPWAAAAVAVALPFGGYTLYWDGATWVSGLVAFMHAPWVWWAFRRVARDSLSPLWGFLVGALAITQGNPYGVLAVVVAGVAVTVESVMTSNFRGLFRVGVLGLCVAAFLPLVYLPLLETVSLTPRGQQQMLGNSGFMRPVLGDLAHLSSPTFVPEILTFADPMRVPTVYMAWFVLPLLPWLDYPALRGRLRPLTGVFVMSGVYLLMTLAPSKLWLFRWPLRLVEYLYLGAGVLLAVLLSRGLRRDRWVARSLGSVGLVAFTSYLLWAEDPMGNAKGLYGSAVLMGLVLALLAVHRWLGTRPPAVFAVLALGTGVVLSTQLSLFEENESAGRWHFPHDVSQIRQNFDDLDGTVVQFADLTPADRRGSDERLRDLWSAYLFGSMYRVAGVDAVNAYTGMGYRDFSLHLCMDFNGKTRSCGFRRIWKPVEPGGPPLADLMKVDTIVVQDLLVPDVREREGWTIENGTPSRVLRRQEPQPWPDSRLSHATSGVTVSSAVAEGRARERVSYSTTGPGPHELTFARLAWPGYRAEVDGRPLDVEANDAGLLTVTLPDGDGGSPGGGARGGDGEGTLVLTYQAPGQRLGLLLVTAGAVGAVSLSIKRRRRRRRALPGTDPARSAGVFRTRRSS